MDEAVERLVKACRDFGGGDPDQALRDATGRFVSRAVKEVSLLGQAAAQLPGLAPAGAAWMAVVLGGAIERESKGVELSGPPLLSAFISWLPQLPVPNDQDEEAGAPDPTPAQAALLGVFPLVCQAVVSHLARMPAERERLARDEALVKRLEQIAGYSHGAIWVHEALLRVSGPLVVLHPPSGKGFRLRFSNVANCFHLFSLIQSVIGRRIPGGRNPDPGVGAAARGESNGKINDAAWWHYGDPRSATSNLAASIWGESRVRSIPVIEGVRVILLWPPQLASRSWDSSFFAPHLAALPADAVLEAELNRPECEAWLARLGIERKKEWWKIW